MYHLRFKMIFSHIIWMDLFLCECTSLFRYFWVVFFFFFCLTMPYDTFLIHYLVRFSLFLCVCKLCTVQVKVCLFAEISWNATIPEWYINSLLHVFFLGPEYLEKESMAHGFLNKEFITFHKKVLGEQSQ